MTQNTHKLIHGALTGCNFISGVYTFGPFSILLRFCSSKKAVQPTLRWMMITPSSGKSAPGWILHVISVSTAALQRTCNTIDRDAPD